MFDKTIILKAAKDIASGDGRQAKIINTMLGEMADLPHESRLEIVKEAVASFSEEDRKGKRKSEYQYASRMGAIIGAVFLTENFQVVGGANAIYSAAVKALRDAKITKEGKPVSEVQAERIEKKKSKLMTQEIATRLVKAGDDAVVSDVRKAAEAAVEKQMTAQVLESLLKSAEAYATRLIVANGPDMAIEFAQALLASVKDQVAKQQQQAA